MINFKSVRWQNFLSTGNQLTEISLNRNKSTLIVGENGAGKSTILDALSFSLYGKPFRNINKPQLCNSITQKNTLVECEFTIGNKEYLIRRGMKPDLFEIHQNGKLVNQSSNVKEYQEILESSILKMNHKTFGQIVVLGSANFIPFMQLPAQTRREVIEDLLDIQIFSVMNSILKEKSASNKTEISNVDYEINLSEQKIELYKVHIDNLKRNNEELIVEKQKLLIEWSANIETANQTINDINQQINELNETISDKNKIEHKKRKALELERKLEEKIKILKRDIKFFQENDNCPTCSQEIQATFKETKIKKREDQLSNVNTALVELEKEIVDSDARINKIVEVVNKIDALNKKITENNNKIFSWNVSIANLNKEIDSIKNNTKIIDENSDQINSETKTLEEKCKLKESLLIDRKVLDASAVLLKDTGIKTKIIKQYIPIMNKLINKYLASMDFFVQFELNENFKETIKSRFRDEFSYDSFSEGEKMRIDLALLFTWRSISKMRNSASTNLLIMDEVFDSSLDSTGTEEFLKILNNLTNDTNVFVISHKGDQLYDKFHSVIKFEKHKNFSRIVPRG